MYGVIKALRNDRFYQAALLVGPLVWGALYLSGVFVQDGGAHLVVLIWPAILFCLVYPVVEELFFRGVVQRCLYDKSALSRVAYFGFSYANAVTTVLFVFAHWFSQPLVWALLVIFPSLLFGWFRDKYNSVIPSLFLHVFYNTGFYLTRLVAG